MILTAFVLFWVVGFIWYIMNLIKRLIVKKSCRNALDEIGNSLKQSGEGIKYIATDKGFHKDLRKEFRIEIIFFSLLGLVLLLALLGVEM